MSETEIGKIFDLLRTHGEALARIETKVSGLPCERHGKILDGNGRGSVEIRLDRLERFKRFFLWVVSGIAALVGGVIQAVMEKVIG